MPGSWSIGQGVPNWHGSAELDSRGARLSCRSRGPADCCVDAGRRGSGEGGDLRVRRRLVLVGRGCRRLRPVQRWLSPQPERLAVAGRRAGGAPPRVFRRDDRARAAVRQGAGSGPADHPADGDRRGARRRHRAADDRRQRRQLRREVESCRANAAGCLKDAAKLDDELADVTPRLMDAYRRLAQVPGVQRVLVVGYPDITPTFDEGTHKCGWMTPSKTRNITRFSEMLDDALAGAAAHAGVPYLSIRGSLDEHECARGTRGSSRSPAPGATRATSSRVTRQGRPAADRRRGPLRARPQSRARGAAALRRRRRRRFTEPLVGSERRRPARPPACDRGALQRCRLGQRVLDRPARQLPLRRLQLRRQADHPDRAHDRDGRRRTSSSAMRGPTRQAWRSPVSGSTGCATARPARRAWRPGRSRA